MKFVEVQTIIFDILKEIIMGRIKAISTSKIRKIMAIKKNRIEKGSRDELKGLKPHSKGDSFSRSFIFFLDKRDDKIMTMVAIARIIQDINHKFRIIYINLLLNLMIGSHIYFI
jgi:hypothetical protein